MSSTWTSRDGYSRVSNSVATAVSDLIQFNSWKQLSIVDVPKENSEVAFDWLVEQHGHNEYNSSYGPTFDSEWFGPFTSYSSPENHCYFIRDRNAATLFKLFQS